MNFVSGLVLPVSRIVAEFAGSKEVNMNVAGSTVLGVLEVVILAIRQRVAHVFFARKQRSTAVNRFTIP